jgi:putative addiction module component (TIGR02574 family)
MVPVNIMTVAELFSASQALPPKERETLCAQIAESLDAPLTGQQRLWADEAERRAEELRSGAATGVPADEVFAKAARRLGM